mmetsp:Transcript_8156/g.23196  ORF Transcript_8156/g.23196 Transcript_8156/m.23196 type:complete len:307 (+) Transcript_8156:430-1350(+)
MSFRCGAGAGDHDDGHTCYLPSRCAKSSCSGSGPGSSSGCGRARGGSAPDRGGNRAACPESGSASAAGQIAGRPASHSGAVRRGGGGPGSHSGADHHGGGRRGGGRPAIHSGAGHHGAGRHGGGLLHARHPQLGVGLCHGRPAPRRRGVCLPRVHGRPVPGVRPGPSRAPRSPSSCALWPPLARVGAARAPPRAHGFAALAPPRAAACASPASPDRRLLPPCGPPAPQRPTQCASSPPLCAGPRRASLDPWPRRTRAGPRAFCVHLPSAAQSPAPSSPAPPWPLRARTALPRPRACACAPRCPCWP